MPLLPLVLMLTAGLAEAEAVQLRADRLAEFAWRTFDNPSSTSGAGTSPSLALVSVLGLACHTSSVRLGSSQAAAASLGQGWVLSAADKTIRVAGHPEFCLDIDGGKTTPGSADHLLVQQRVDPPGPQPAV